MSAYFDVFAKPLGFEADLLTDAAHILNASSVKMAAGSGHGIPSDHATVDVILEHDLDDDGLLLFTQYPCYLTVRDWNRDKERSEVLARSLARQLQDTGRYQCMIVWNDTQLVQLD